MVDSTGFVTSLVINVAIAIIAMSFFIYARPRYPWCYDTRRNAKRRVVGTEPPTIRPGAFSWVTQTLLMTDAQILSTAGLDGLMMIKFFEMCFTLFSVLIVLGIGILLPVNFTGPNFSDPGKRVTDAFDQMSMATIPPGNRRFWAHLIVGYCFCFTFYYLAFHMWKTYMNLRHQHLARWTLLGGNHTILIHELPAEIRTDAALLAHFSGLYPGQVRSARMAKDLRMDAKERKEGRGDNELDSLQDNVAARDNVIAALEHDVAAWNKQQTDPKVPEEKRAIRAQTATKMLCCGKTDAIDYHYSELERLNRIIAAKQASYEPTRDAKSIPTLLSGFVTFHSARIAVAAANAYTYDSVSFSFDVKAAPELRDVYWPALNLTHFQRSMRTIIFDILTALLIVFWMIPMAFLTGLSNLSGLAAKYSWLSGINSIPSVILGFIEAHLPAILLAVFFAILPLILLAFSQQQGIEANSWLERSVIHKYFLFMVVNFFFGAIVGGAIFSNIQELLGDVNGIPTVLGNQIPTVSNYFVNYVALAAFAGFPLQMAQAPRLIVGGLKKKYLSLTTREFEAAEAPPSLNYGVSYCPHLFIFLVAMTYSFIAPIIVPFAAVYYGLGWMVHKYQIVHVYVQSFERGGVFWPVVYSKMSASLFIAQVCLVGILGLKEVPAQAALVVPLPFITLAFDYYISKAIKSKLISLPLSQMLEIDTLRKAERLAREGDNETTDKKAGPVPTKDGAAGGSDSSRDQSARAASQSGAVHAGSSAPGQVEMNMPDGRLASDLVSARASDLPKTSMQYENRNEDATVSTPRVRLHTLPRVVQQADQNGVTGQTRSYVADEPHQHEVQLKGSEVQQASGKAGSEAPRATQALGFPYANDEQDRAFVEGDVPAYVQPELTDATPAEVVVDGAQQLLSHSEAAKQTTVVRISEAGRGHQQKQQHDAAAASVAHDQRDVEAQTHTY